MMAGGPGFEPELTGPEPVVLPLDDPPAFCERIHYKIIIKESRKMYCHPHIKEDKKLRRSEGQQIRK